MNGRGVVTVVRGWVELYTRGLPPAVRAARRDEVDDDLWCQHDEAIAIGRSPRALAGEMLLRLFLGMPADLSWRASQGRTPANAPPERSPSTRTRVIGALAILGGISWGILIGFTMVSAPTQWTGTTGLAVFVLLLGGGSGLAGAIVGSAWLFQDEIRSRAGLAAAVGSLAIILETLGGYGAIGVAPIASTVLIWELAHIGVLSRALAVVHGLTAVTFVALVVSSRIDYAGTLSNQLLVALGMPYMLTWIVIGGVFIRGVRAAHQPARGG